MSTGRRKNHAIKSFMERAKRRDSDASVTLEDLKNQRNLPPIMNNLMELAQEESHGDLNIKDMSAISVHNKSLSVLNNKVDDLEDPDKQGMKRQESNRVSLARGSLISKRNDSVDSSRSNVLDHSKSGLNANIRERSSMLEQ